MNGVSNGHYKAHKTPTSPPAAPRPEEEDIKAKKSKSAPVVSAHAKVVDRSAQAEVSSHLSWLTI